MGILHCPARPCAGRVPDTDKQTDTSVLLQKPVAEVDSQYGRASHTTSGTLSQPTMRSFTRTTLALASALALGALPANAQQAAVRSAPSISVRALNTTAAAEAAKKKGGAARTAVLPGDVLRYTLAFTNSTDKPVRNVELRDPIPAGVRFVAGSARASRPDVRLEFSADGGRTWSAAPVEAGMVDGKPVSRTIAPDRYTHVRWLVTGAVAPHAMVTAEFDARVGGAGA